jgi:hypothetical protein
MKICYVEKNFRPASRVLIDQANAEIASLHAQGYDLTLRQLYYQLVAKNVIPNTPTSYDNLGNLVNDARLAGLISWHAIIDRTRNQKKNPHWENPKDFLEQVSPQFGIDKWEGQAYRPEVWVEKDALVGIVEKISRELDVPYFSCRGYTSQSEMWAAAQRLIDWRDNHGQTPVIIHLGDHDPSGIDMTRDIEDRLKLFCEDEIEVRRIALSRAQVNRYRLPPNPAKLTDCRANAYIQIHGASSWELDALNPKVISDLIRAEIDDLREDDKFDDRQDDENRGRDQLIKAAKGFK